MTWCAPMRHPYAPSLPHLLICLALMALLTPPLWLGRAAMWGWDRWR
jgi:hypothetical protein